MATISNTPRPGYVWDATDNVWYPIGVGGHGHPDYITQATAVNPTIIDAKGDILTATAADTPARLAVGNNGETLVADSSTSTGLRYQGTQSAGKNASINGGFDVWQRGTSFAASTAEYTADRWQKWTSTTNITVSRQASGLTGILYCARFQRNVGTTSTGSFDYWSSFESQDSYRFAGQTVTLSFYARAGANYSASGNGIQARLYSGTGTDQNLQVGGFTGAVAVINQTPTLTTSWQRFSYTGTVGSSATQVGIDFTYAPTGTAGANDYYEVTGVQLELGSVATNFLRTGATLQGELAACQRYYWRFTGPNANSAYGSGSFGSSTNGYLDIPYPTAMRTAPGAIDFSLLAVQDAANGSYASITGLTINQASNKSASLSFTIASGGTTYRWIRLINDSNAAGYLGLSAEL
jgi:hypothetical protein